MLAHADGRAFEVILVLGHCDAEQIAYVWLRPRAVEYPGLVPRPLVGSAVDATREYPADTSAAANREQMLVELRGSPEHRAHVGGQVNALRRSLDLDAVF